MPWGATHTMVSTHGSHFTGVMRMMTRGTSHGITLMCELNTLPGYTPEGHIATLAHAAADCNTAMAELAAVLKVSCIGGMLVLNSNDGFSCAEVDTCWSHAVGCWVVMGQLPTNLLQHPTLLCPQRTGRAYLHLLVSSMCHTLSGAACLSCCSA